MDEQLLFLLEVADEDLVEVEVNGTLYPMTGPDAVVLALNFLD